MSRPRLTARLNNSLHVPLTLVVAPAGFGKTTLLADWLVTRDSAAPAAAWLTVDHDDRLLPRFVAHVAAAIERISPQTALVLDALSRPCLLPASELGATFANELRDVSHDVVLVFDDFHQAGSAEVADFLGGVLHATPPSLHLILAARRDPALPLARMRLLGELNEIRASDLRFTEHETRTLLSLTGRAAGEPEFATMLQEATKGWIAGLRLALVSPPGTADRDRLADAIASDQHVMDFLGEEVLAKQSATTQDFMLRTALVERISASLADALVSQPPPEGSRALLTSLAREHLFVEPDGDDGAWFRYQPLFRSYLLQLVALRFSGQALDELHARASAWFVARGLLDEAIRHRMLAGDTAGAAHLVEQHVHQSLNREDWTTLAGWIRALPEAVIETSPTLLLAKACIAQLSGRLVAARAIDAALSASLAASASDARGTDALVAEGNALILGQLHTINQDPAAAAAAVLAVIERLPAEHRFARGLAYLTHGCALQSAGQTEAAVRWLTDISERETERIDAGSIRAVLGLVFVHRQAGNFQACEESAQRLLDLARRHELPISAGWAHWALGWLAYERDDLDTAVAHFLAILNNHHRLYMSCVCDG
ncbi:MAG: hypothetical protein KC442_05860, partial [Thermomicrobiales bacterium]|nr:hypothetical protein [Thermomicrobiales bacterium]